MIDKLEPMEWLKLNAQLQAKKRNLREELSKKGVLKREGKNTYDRYSYFSEAQYKELFTELLPKYNLELNFNEVDYKTFTVEGKQPNGRMPTIVFSLIDIETGFYENTTITGEGIDKGDKAGYKAYTGALKYFLADKFMVATGDDSETESPDGRGGMPQDNPKINKKDLRDLQGYADEVGISAEQICATFKVESLPELTKAQWAHAMRMLNDEAAKKKGE